MYGILAHHPRQSRIARIAFHFLNSFHFESFNDPAMVSSKSLFLHCFKNFRPCLSLCQPFSGSELLDLVLCYLALLKNVSFTRQLIQLCFFLHSSFLSTLNEAFSYYHHSWLNEVLPLSQSLKIIVQSLLLSDDCELYGWI